MNLPPTLKLTSWVEQRASHEPSWRSEWLPLVLLTAVGLFVFTPLVRHPSDLLVGVQHQGHNDLTSQFVAFQSFPRSAVHQGEIPWWNPSLLGGAPWFGNPQSALLYPANWLYYFVNPLTWMSWVMVAHHLVGGWGAYRLARRWDLRWETALLAGVAYLGAPFLLAQTGEGHYNQICVIAWLPWAWLAWERLAAGERFGRLLFVGALVLSFTASHVQEWYYLLVLLGTLTAWELLGRWRKRDRQGALRLARDAGLAVALTVGIVAIELIPTYLNTTQTVRGGSISTAEAGGISLGLASVRQLILPLALGGPDSYRGPGFFYWETLFHFGVLPLALCVLGFVLGRHDVRWRRLAVLAVLSVAFAFGDGSPVFAVAHRVVPGVSMFRAPSRALFFVSLFVALSSAYGLERLLSGRRRSVAVPDAANSPSSASTSAAATATTELKWSRMRQCAALGIVALAVFESHRMAQQILRTLPTNTLRDHSELLATLGPTRSESRVLAEQSLLSDREAWQAGLLKIQGYDPVPHVRQVALIDAMTPSGDPAPLALGFQRIDLSQLDANALRAAGVRWALVSPQKSAPPDGWKLVTRGQLPPEFVLRGATPSPLKFELYENTRALPRAFVVGNGVVADARQSIQRLAEIDARREVLVPVDPLPAAETAARADYQAAEIVAAGPASLTVAARLNRPGFLVVQDTYAPGWTVKIDGQPSTMLPANVAARAVPMLAGEHRVEFSFRPPGLAFGALVSALSLLVLGWWIMFSDARATHSSAASPARPAT